MLLGQRTVEYVRAMAALHDVLREHQAVMRCQLMLLQVLEPQRNVDDGDDAFDWSVRPKRLRCVLRGALMQQFVQIL